MKLKKIAALIALAGLSGSAFATNGYFPHGYGMKAKGMGGVGIAYGQDAMAAATNPANMVLVGNRWDVGVEYFRPQRDASINGNAFPGVDGKYDGNSSENYFVPEFGYNKMIANNMSLGVSVYGNGGMATDYDKNPFTGFGATGNAGVDLSQLMIAPTLSYKLNENHAIGVSLKIAYQRFEAFGIQPFAIISSNGAKLSNNGHDSSWGYGIGLGWTGQITPTVKLGATYQSKTKMQEFDDYKGLFAEQGGFDIPENYGLGMSWQATPQFVIAADVTQINFSKVRSVGNVLAEGGPLGANNGSGFGWDDMTVYKIGFAYDLNKEWTVRAGYNHGKQPIPKSQTFFNILAPATVEDHLTLGATWRLASGGEVSFAYMHAFEETVKGSNSIPAGFAGGNANLKMYEDSFGISYGVKF
jgi:long-chain fatty acid transport protein